MRIRVHLYPPLNNAAGRSRMEVVLDPGEPSLQALIDKSQEFVSGTARVKLYKGAASVVGRSSPYSLYSLAHVTFEEDAVYDQKDAEGFIKLNALRLRLLARRDRQSER